MSQPSSLPDADEELLVDFQKEYVSAANRAAALEQWCARHVPLVQRLRARAVMVDAFAKAQPEAQPEAVESVKAEPLQLGEFRIDGTIGGGMEKVYLAFYEGNERGRRAYEKAGYRLEGTLPRDAWHDGRFVTSYVMAAYRDDPLYRS